MPWKPLQVHFPQSKMIKLRGWFPSLMHAPLHSVPFLSALGGFLRAHLVDEPLELVGLDLVQRILAHAVHHAGPIRDSLAPLRQVPAQRALFM